MRYLAIAAGAVLLFVFPAVLQAETWTIDPAHSNAQFSVRHMMVSTVRGEFTKVAGTIDLDEKDITKSKIEATIDAASINTRNEKRDGHLKSADFFDAANHPTITFKSTKIEKTGEGKLKATGDLTIRGVTKSVVLNVDELSPSFKDRQGNLHTGTSATTKIHRKDFGVSWNAALDSGGLMVGEEVSITIDVELIKQAAPSQGAAN
jgi:polyisoprenoid-binding protein YceI